MGQPKTRSLGNPIPQRDCVNQNKYGTQEDPVNKKSTINAVRKRGEEFNKKFSKLFNSPKPCHTKIIDNPLTSSTESVVILSIRKDLSYSLTYAGRQVPEFSKN